MTQHDTVTPGERQRRESGPLRSTVIVNPVRVTDIDKRRAVVDAELQAAGWPPAHWVETTEEDPGAGQARQAVADGYDVVFVCGGDGTVRSCVEGLAGSDAALAVLPAGTGNLLAANLSLPDDPAEGVRLAVQRGRRRMDVGEVDGQVFAVMTGMGFDAQLLASASTKLKSVIGSPAYVVSGLKHLRDRSMHVEIRIDDQPPMRRSARSVLIGNVGRLQGGVRLLRDAEPDNGQLEVAVLAPRSLLHWAALAWGVLRGRKRVPRMEVFRGRHIVVTSDRKEPRELDGDVMEPGHVLDVRVRPSALWLCVPQPDDSPDIAEGA